MANSISFSGLGSGVDTSSIVEELIRLERVPISNVQTRQDREKTKQQALQSGDVDDVLRPKPEWPTLLWRGLVKHCPRCGGGHIYRTWFQMVERCPTCGYLFEREPGFFVGAYLINFAIVEGFLFILLMGFIAWKDQNPDAGMPLAIVIGLFIGLVGPVIFYPYSRTIWSALDLLMTPLEVGEIVAAADAVSDEPPLDDPRAD